MESTGGGIRDKTHLKLICNVQYHIEISIDYLGLNAVSTRRLRAFVNVQCASLKSSWVLPRGPNPPSLADFSFRQAVKVGIVIVIVIDMLALMVTERFMKGFVTFDVSEHR